MHRAGGVLPHGYPSSPCSHTSPAGRGDDPGRIASPGLWNGELYGQSSLIHKLICMEDWRVLLLLLISRRKSCRVKCSCQSRGKRQALFSSFCMLLPWLAPSGVQGHTHPTLLPFQVPDEQMVNWGWGEGNPMSRSWLLLG